MVVGRCIPDCCWALRWVGSGMAGKPPGCKVAARNPGPEEIDLERQVTAIISRALVYLHPIDLPIPFADISSLVMAPAAYHSANEEKCCQKTTERVTFCCIWVCVNDLLSFARCKCTVSWSFTKAENSALCVM